MDKACDGKLSLGHDGSPREHEPQRKKDQGAKGEGELRANLADWTVDGGIEFKFNGEAAAPPVQLRFNGPLTGGNKSFESAALQAYVLERAAKQEAERRAAAERAVQQQRQQAPARPAAPPATQRPPAPAAAPAVPSSAPPSDAFINDVLQSLPAR